MRLDKPAERSLVAAANRLEQRSLVSRLRAQRARFAVRR